MSEQQLPQYASELREELKKRNLNIVEAVRQSGVSERVLGGLYRGSVKNLDRVSVEARKKLWNTYHLQIFYSPYFEPINTEKDSPAVQLMKYIVENYKGSIDQFARDKGFDRGTIRYFISGEHSKMKPRIQQKVYEVTRLECFNNSELTKISKPQIKEETMKEETTSDLTERLSRISEGLESLKLEFAQNISKYEASQLLREREPTLEERMKTVETVIDILVEQINYYKTAPQEERESLVRHLRDLDEIDRWGYVVNIMHGLAKPGNTPDTFARSLEPPPKKYNKYS